MREHTASINPSEILIYAGDVPHVLTSLVGQRVNHYIFGTGRIESVEDKRYIHVEFDEKTKGINRRTFTKSAFYDGKFTEVVVPTALFGQIQKNKPEIEQKKRWHEQEAEAERSFSRLKQKYSVAWYSDSSPLSPLHKILLQLEQQETLSDEDIEWLRAEKLFVVLGSYFEFMHETTADPWHLIKASRYWRASQRPSRSITITDNYTTQDKVAMAAILTTRGGAFRDLMELDGAEICGLEALKYNQRRHHPYNLLGAVYYQKGNPQLGDSYFETAMAKGGSPKDRVTSVERALKEADEDVRKKVAEYLLQKDAQEYAWVRRYVEQEIPCH